MDKHDDWQQDAQRKIEGAKEAIAKHFTVRQYLQKRINDIEGEIEGLEDYIAGVRVKIKRRLNNE